MDRRWCTPKSFFLFRFPCLSNVLTSFVSLDSQRLAHAWRWRFPFSSRGRSQFNLLVFNIQSHQNFSSSQLLWDNGEKVCKRTDSNALKKFFYSVKSVNNNQGLSSNPRASDHLESVRTKYFWRGSFFGDDFLDCFVYFAGFHMMSLKLKLQNYLSSWDLLHDV